MYCMFNSELRVRVHVVDRDIWDLDRLLAIHTLTSLEKRRTGGLHVPPREETEGHVTFGRIVDGARNDGNRIVHLVREHGSTEQP